MRAPFPWFGGKSRVSAEVWRRFAGVKNYVEPFFGSGAVMLDGPTGITRTANDADGLVANFWRAVISSPDEVAHWADYPVSECDLHARHVWLLGQLDGLPERLMGDPDFCNPKVAGWWVWGICSWIGSGWCTGEGPWSSVDGVLTTGDKGQGVNRKRPHLGNKGQGVNREGYIQSYIAELSEHLAGVRFCCGDWSRVCGPSVTFKHGITGVFLDPPYADTAEREEGLYRVDCDKVAHDVRAWCLDNAHNDMLMIALCGYEGEHDMPSDWSVHRWSSKGAYKGAGGTDDNRKRERVWFSPSCGKQPSLFGGLM